MGMYTKASIGFTGAKTLVSAFAPTTTSAKKSISGWFGRSKGTEASVETQETEVTKDANADADAATASGVTDNDTHNEEATEDAIRANARAEFSMNNMVIIAWRMVELDIRST